MGGRAEVMKLDQQIVDVDVQAVLESHERRRRGEVPPVDRLPDAVDAKDARLENQLATALVSHDRGEGKEAVAIRVVAMMVRVDKDAGRRSRDRLDTLEVRASPGFCRAGVDAHDDLVSDNEARVVDPPAAVGLDVGEDPISDLDDLRRQRGRVAVVVVYVRCGHR